MQSLELLAALPANDHDRLRAALLLASRKTADRLAVYELKSVVSNVWPWRLADAALWGSLAYLIFFIIR